jgi:hypothetical protein
MARYRKGMEPLPVRKTHKEETTMQWEVKKNIKVWTPEEREAKLKRLDELIIAVAKEEIERQAKPSMTDEEFLAILAEGRLPY